MDKLILLPLIISAILLLDRKPKDVFIWVFLPSLTLLPTYFDTKLVQGIPELQFWSAALLPILAAWIFKNFEGYHFHWMDWIILSYILVIFFGQWTNGTYKEAQKILFNNTMAMFFPYIMIRSFCSDRETLLKVIWMVTILGAIVALFNLIEFRMFTNYFDQILRKIWPRYVVWDTGMVMGRMGFKRAFGPFSHPIIAGYMFSLIAPLSIWSYFQGLYRNKYIGRIIVFLNIIGIFVAISRAPIIGFFIGLGIIYYGWSNKKMTIGIIFSVIFGIIIVTSLPKITSYVNVTRASAKTTDQRNVAYRKEMWEAYIDIVKERPYIGWGRFTVPTIRGMDSIDSEYLSVALSSGLIALSFYLIFLFGMLIRLFRSAQMKKHDDPMARLAWCLIAGWVSAIFSFGTVYSGAQSIHYMFMLGGVGQIIVLGAVREWASTKESIEKLPVLGHGFGFARVI